MANYDPDIKSTEYEYLYPEWQKINAILGGTRTMREAGAEYLLRHERESQSGYQSRLQRSYLYNGLEICANSLASKPLKDSIKLEERTDEITEFLSRVNNNKNSLETFLSLIHI